MARKQATDAQRTEVRAGIRRAAAKVYRDKGVAGTTARAIALEANVSVGTIYTHFGDLPSLMQSLWMEPLDQINDQFRDVARAHADPLRRLKALMETYVQVAADHPELYRTAFLFVRPKALQVPEQMPLQSIVFADLLLAAIKDGQAAGAIKAGDTERMAQLLWAGLHGCIALPINFDRVALSGAETLAIDMIEALLAQLA